MTLILYLHEISLVHTIVSLVETANLPFSDHKKNVLVIQKKNVHSLSFIQIIL